MKKTFNRLLKPFGYEIVNLSKAPFQDILEDEEFENLYAACAPYTMTPRERMYGLYQAVRYIVARDIPGDFVECGVWQGGSVMLMALTLDLVGGKNRKIHLYDTFEGMAPPTERDVDLKGGTAARQMEEQTKVDGAVTGWAHASLQHVQRNLERTGLGMERFVFVPGKVEDTVPGTCPEAISLLRLDTDWYESTRHELRYLYPLLSPRGVLIIDDYGHWRGAREATDEFFEDTPLLLLNRMDYSARIAIKS